MQALLSGKMDVAFLRPDDAVHGLDFRLITKEALFVLLPANHRLATHTSIHLTEIAAEPFISFPKRYAPALRRVIDEYLAYSRVPVTPVHEAETLPMVISLVLSSHGVSFMPDYARRLLPPSVVNRPLDGTAPTIDLALGYSRTNPSPLLKLFLSKAEACLR